MYYIPRAFSLLVYGLQHGSMYDVHIKSMNNKTRSSATRVDFTQAVGHPSWENYGTDFFAIVHRSIPSKSSFLCFLPTPPNPQLTVPAPPSSSFSFGTRTCYVKHKITMMLHSLITKFHVTKFKR